MLKSIILILACSYYIAMIEALVTPKQTMGLNMGTIHVDRPSYIAVNVPPLRKTSVPIHAHARTISSTIRPRVLVQPVATRFVEEVRQSPLWRENCNSQLMNSVAENKQLQSYITGIESLTGTIQELDEAVQQIKPATKSCEQLVGSPRSEILLGSVEALIDTSTFNPTNAPIESTSTPATTTESFTDPPFVPLGRGRRTVTNQPDLFGMPSTSTTPALPQDQAGEDLIKASNDLKALRKDLSVTAEWLKQTNHTVHSVMLKALQAYVTSIERRVDNQLQLYTQTRVTGLKTKIAAIKEKVANLMEKLRTLGPFKLQNNINREDQGSPVGLATTVSSVSSTLVVTSPTSSVTNGVTVPMHSTTIHP